jgi:hypothetical protein
MPFGLLILRCPNTGKEIDTGVSFNRSELARIKPRQLRGMHCPLCGESHGFSFSEAWLKPPSRPE